MKRVQKSICINWVDRKGFSEALTFKLRHEDERQRGRKIQAKILSSPKVLCQKSAHHVQGTKRRPVWQESEWSDQDKPREQSK